MNLNTRQFLIRQFLRYQSISETVVKDLSEKIIDFCFETNSESFKSDFFDKYTMLICDRTLLYAKSKTKENATSQEIEKFFNSKINAQKFFYELQNFAFKKDIDGFESYLSNNLKYINEIDYEAFEFIFAYCLKHNLIKIIALFADFIPNFNFFEKVDVKIVKKIIEIRNSKNSHNVINENSRFFASFFKFFDLKHLQCYSIDSLLKVFTNMIFMEKNNFSKINFRKIVIVFLDKSPYPEYFLEYLKSVYTIKLNDIFSEIITIYLGKILQEKDQIVLKNNLSQLIPAIVSLPISNRSKNNFLNNIKFTATVENIVMYRKLMSTILPYEEAVKRIFNILYMEYNFDKTVTSILELVDVE